LFKWPFLQVYPGKGKRLKAAKNNPGVLRWYVTYDTLHAWQYPVADFGYLLDGSCGARTAFLDLQRGRILLQNMTKLTAVARNE
jgi:hypothetical protein